MSSTAPASPQQNASFSLDDHKKLPAFYRAADRAAKGHQRWYFFSIYVEIVLTVLGALALVLEQNPAFVHAVGIVGSIQVRGKTILPLSLTTAFTLLATAATFGVQYTFKPGDKWRQCRFLAERCLTLVWRYVGHATPLDLQQQSPDPAKVDEYYAEQIKALLKRAEGLNLPPTPEGEDTSELTDMMVTVRKDSLAERFKVYFDQRAENQRKWYYDKARKFRRWRNFWRTITIVIYVLGAVVVALHATALRVQVPGDLLLPNYWPLVVALAGAVTAYIAARHYDDLKRTYSYMAACLRVELDAKKSNFSPTEAAVTTWVDELETFMDGEHQQWHALTEKGFTDSAKSFP